MRILFLSHGRTCEDQIGYHEALFKAECEGVPVECRELPFLGIAEKFGWNYFYNEVIRINNEWRPDVVFFQFFHGGNIASPSECIAQLKANGHRPIVIGSQGDAFDVKLMGTWRRRPEKALVDLAICADAFFSTTMGAFADYLARKGAKNVIFLPHAFSEPHFREFDLDAPTNKEYDIAMVGSIGFSRRRPIGTFLHAHNRKHVADALWQHYGNGFVLYGNGWRHPACKGPVAFHEQVRVFRSAKCAVDAPAPYNEVYYASDRPFFIAGCGTPLVQFYSPRFDKVLREGEHVFFVRKGMDVCSVCNRVLACSQEELEEISSRSRAFVLARHTVQKRVDTMLSVVERLRGRQTQMRLWHFLPDVDTANEMKFAGRNLTIC